MMFRSALGASRWRAPTFRPIHIIYSRKYFNSKVSVNKSRTWKSTFFRWVLVIGGIYYYNKYDFYMRGPEVALMEDEDRVEDIDQKRRVTIDAIFEQRRQRHALKLAEHQSQENVTELVNYEALNGKSDRDNQVKQQEILKDEDQPGQEGAFDPETGTINWDCPCLGGMAQGPCGEEFKAAFSCFVHSKEEPKGVECIDKFKTMQSCFRQYPDVYGAELEDESPDSESIEQEISEEFEVTPKISENSSKLIPQTTSQPKDLDKVSTLENEKSDVTHEKKNESSAKLSGTKSN